MCTSSLEKNGEKSNGNNDKRKKMNGNLKIENSKDTINVRKRDPNSSRRDKYTKEESLSYNGTKQQPCNISKQKTRSNQKHANDKPSGGIESLLPSFIGIVILCCGVMARMGFRGRATVAGIDLGTTNSVICVQAPSKGVGHIDCINDPITNSPIIPSVVSFLDKSEHKVGPSSKIKSLLNPHPTTVVVGASAKRRIDSHPHHTLYNAKRILGKDSNDSAVQILRKEVEFGIVTGDANNNHMNDNTSSGVYFTVPDTKLLISPVQVGGYVVNHLKNIMDMVLGHENVRSAVICVPAKFTSHQRQLTVNAFQLAGIKVVRIIEEPTAAALAYGLHRKPNVNYILVYDFGGGTLDVSLLYVTNDFVDVMGSDGDENLGGTDFDIHIAQYLLETNELQKAVSTVADALVILEKQYSTESSKTSNTDLEEKLASTCPKLENIPLCTVSSFHTIGEQLKIRLSNLYDSQQSSGDTSSISASSECFVLDPDRSLKQITSLDDFCNSLKPLQLTISLEEFEDVVQSLLQRSVLPVQRLLKDLNLKVADIDEIVMVGGTTRLPQIRNLIKQYMQVDSLNTHIDPDITVAYGAASVID